MPHRLSKIAASFASDIIPPAIAMLAHTCQWNEQNLSEVAEDHSLITKLPHEVIHIRVDPRMATIVLRFIANDIAYVAKLLPRGAEHRNKKLEVAIANYLTDRFYKTDRVPGICPVYLAAQGDRLSDVIIQGEIPCPTLEDSYLGRHNLLPDDLKVCQLLGKTNIDGFDISDLGTPVISDAAKAYYLMVTPSRDVLYDVLYRIMTTRVQELGVGESSSQALDVLDRIIFQIVFTLAVIQEDCPGFTHSDLALRNIVANYTSDPDGLSISHYFGGKAWCHPAHGIGVEIIDFGMARILPSGQAGGSREQLHHDIGATSDSITQCDNVWWFLKELYIEIYSMCRNNRIPNAARRSLLERVERLLDMDIVGDLFEYDVRRDMIGAAFSLKRFPKILATAKTPQEYLLGGYFDHMLLPEDSETKIAYRFNHPDGPLPIDMEE